MFIKADQLIFNEQIWNPSKKDNNFRKWDFSKIQI